MSQGLTHAPSSGMCSYIPRRRTPSDTAPLALCLPRSGGNARWAHAMLHSPIPYACMVLASHLSFKLFVLVGHQYSDLSFL